jgi:hypothetical protein
VIKPVFGAAGEGILFLNSVEQLKMYDFPMGEVCLEEFLDLDKAEDGLVLSPAMHYNEGALLASLQCLWMTLQCLADVSLTSAGDSMPRTLTHLNLSRFSPLSLSPSRRRCAPWQGSR